MANIEDVYKKLIELHKELLEITTVGIVNGATEAKQDDIIAELRAEIKKFDGKVSTVDENKPKNVNKKLPQYDRFKHIFERIEKDRSANYKITIDYLHNNFKKEDIDHLINTNVLIKQGNNEFVLGGK